MELPPDVEPWIDLYERRFPRTRANGRRALTALYELLRDAPAGGFTVRDIAARARVGLDTVARALHHLRELGILSVDGGGWVAERGGRPGHGVRYTYVTHWPPRVARPAAVRTGPTHVVAIAGDSGIVAGGGSSGQE
jgi:hypothetical protein